MCEVELAVRKAGPSIEISVEAGDWPPEAELRDIAERAVEAAVAALRESDGATGASPPLPGRERPSPSEARNRVRVPAQRSTLVTLTRSLRDSASPVPGEEGASVEPYEKTLPQGDGRWLARDSELSILFTDDAAIRKLNAAWRGRDRPTNVLSFPQAFGPLLGDVILAAETVREEAALARKPFEDHMAHLIVHGFLHLVGYDHAADEEAEAMEALERDALKRMGIADPYAPAREI